MQYCSSYFGPLPVVRDFRFPLFVQEGDSIDCFHSQILYLVFAGGAYQSGSIWSLQVGGNRKHSEGKRLRRCSRTPTEHTGTPKARQDWSHVTWVKPSVTSFISGHYYLCLLCFLWSSLARPASVFAVGRSSLFNDTTPRHIYNLFLHVRRT